MTVACSLNQETYAANTCLNTARAAIVVVTHNHRAHMESCLRSLLHQTYPAMTIYVIDNASHDGTVEDISSAFPSIRMIPNSRNRGFAAACNQGISLAIQEGADQIALLNPDTVVHPDWLKELIAAEQRNPQVGIVQSLIFEGLPPSHTLNSRGNCQQYLGFGFCEKRALDPSEAGPHDIAFASGAACLLTRELVNTIGGFDEGYFLYHEDLDLGQRARLAGFRIILAPRSLAWHHYTFDRGTRKLYYLERNRLRTLVKNYETKTLLLLLPALLLTEAALLIHAMRGGWLGLKMRGYRELITDLPTLIRARRAIQTLRVRSDRELAQLWTSHLHQAELDGWGLRILNGFWKTYWRGIRRWV